MTSISHYKSMCRYNLYKNTKFLQKWWPESCIISLKIWDAWNDNTLPSCNWHVPLFFGKTTKPNSYNFSGEPCMFLPIWLKKTYNILVDDYLMSAWINRIESTAFQSCLTALPHVAVNCYGENIWNLEPEKTRYESHTSSVTLDTILSLCKSQFPNL